MSVSADEAGVLRPWGVLRRPMCPQQLGKTRKTVGAAMIKQEITGLEINNSSLTTRFWKSLTYLLIVPNGLERS